MNDNEKLPAVQTRRAIFLETIDKISKYVIIKSQPRRGLLQCRFIKFETVSFFVEKQEKKKFNRRNLVIKKMLKSKLFLLSLILIAVFLCSAAFGGVPAAASEMEVDNEFQTKYREFYEKTHDHDSVYNKIHFYFDEEEHNTIDDWEELEAATNALKEQEAKVNEISLVGAEPLEEIQMTVQFESDFMNTKKYLAFARERSRVETSEDVADFRARLNAYSKSYHEELFEKNAATLSRLGYSEVKAIAYSPFATVKVSAEQIETVSLLQIAELSNVVNLSLSHEEKPVSQVTWNNTLKEINAYEIVSKGTYTGKGIKIGVYEADGICDTTNKNLKDKNITKKQSSSTIDYHATVVTSIIAVMAPNAEFYVSQVDEIGIGWFIQQGCDVVNCSFAWDSDTYSYEIDAVFDYQILANFITVIAASGNISTLKSNKVHSPGLAYNVITVGGVKRVLSGLKYVLKYDEGACYVSSWPEVKPNISAIYTVSVPNWGEMSGTSFAAPQVTACAALLMESHVAYKLYPAKVLSAMSAAAQKTADYVTDKGQFDSRVGAGVVDLQRTLNINSVNLYNGWPDGETEYYSISVNLNKGAELQVGLGWYAHALYTNSGLTKLDEVYVTDYDLRIYTPAGTLIEPFVADSNVEMIRYTATEAGTHKIVVYQYNKKLRDLIAEDLWLSYIY